MLFVLDFMVPMTTCLNRWLGRCPECKEDYDLNHKPNNYDCPGYKETNPITFYVAKCNSELKGLEKVA